MREQKDSPTSQDESLEAAGTINFPISEADIQVRGKNGDIPVSLVDEYESERTAGDLRTFDMGSPFDAEV